MITEFSGLINIFSSKFLQYSTILIIFLVGFYKFFMGFLVSWLAGKRQMDRFLWFVLGIALGLSALIAIVGSIGAKGLKHKWKNHENSENQKCKGAETQACKKSFRTN